MEAAVMVRPGGEVVVPLAPELIRNEAGLENGGERKYEERLESKCRGPAVHPFQNSLFLLS
jgi:hypothetical protein